MSDPDLTLAILRDIRAKLDQTNKRFDDVDKRFAETNSRLDYLSNQLFFFNQYLRHRVERAIIHLTRRVTVLEGNKP